MKHDEFIRVVTTLQNFDKECLRWEDFGIPLWDLPICTIALEFVDTYLANNLNEEDIATFWEYYDVLTPEALWTLITNKQKENE